MDDEVSSDLQKCLSEGPMDTDEGPLINENSNGLSHLLTEGEFNSVDAVAVDESSTSNHGFLNTAELSVESVGDYLENNADSFNGNSFDVGDNAVSYPNESLNNMLSDNDSRLSDTYKVVSDGESQMKTEFEKEVNEISNDVQFTIPEENTNNTDFGDTENSLDAQVDPVVEKVDLVEEDIHQVDNEAIVEPNIHHVDNEAIVKPNIHHVGNEAIVEPDAEMSQPATEEETHHLVNQEFDIPPRDENIVADKFDIASAIPEEIVQKSASPEPKDIAESGDAGETEVVSEDELPTVQKPSVTDAENVSDDELPGPKPADLPADTEVVSDDEMKETSEGTESRKRKTDNDKDSTSPAEDNENASKKQAVAKEGESKPIPAEKRPSTDEKPKKKALPELDKYWKVVNNDPTDFTGWTYLLQYVDQESDIDATREAYDAFLSHYPYCYGYWRKYADYEKRKGSKKKCHEVLERGLKAIPLSVDLWIHYLNHVKATRAEDHAYIRQQYERSIETCGLEFRSDRLWESYIKWEAENGSALQVTGIYDRLLATPTLGYTSHFDNFQEHVMSEPVSGVISKEELVRLRSEVRDAAGAVPQLDLPPGEDEPADHVASDEEGQAIKERIIAARRKIHKTTGEEVASRWAFEEGIKRPYFHVKPLERCQLKNWKLYLEWEKQHGSLKRSLVLHERCLIACALYDEFWMRLIKFLEERSESNPELIPIEREVLERACTVHHLDKPELHLHWAHFEEAQGNTAKAAEILDRIEKTCPNIVQIQYSFLGELLILAIQRRKSHNLLGTMESTTGFAKDFFM